MLFDTMKYRFYAADDLDASIEEEGDEELLQVVLTDSETGEEHYFDVYDEFAHDGEDYLLLLESQSEEKAEDEEQEVIFMRIVREGDDEYMESLEDEEFDKVREAYLQMLDEYFEDGDSEEQ